MSENTSKVVAHIKILKPPEELTARLFRVDQCGFLIFCDSATSIIACDYEHLQGGADFKDYILEGFVKYRLQLLPAVDGTLLTLSGYGSNRDHAIVSAIKHYFKRAAIVDYEVVSPEANASQSSGILLRVVTESDLPVLFEHQQQPEANKMAAFPTRDRDAFMTHWTKILGDQTVVAMTILIDGRVAGHIGSWRQEGQRLVGYWIGQEFWGRGVATQMLRMFLSRISDRPLCAHVAKHNIASIRVLEKCGFELCTDATGALPKPADGIEELVYVFNTPWVDDT